MPKEKESEEEIANVLMDDLADFERYINDLMVSIPHPIYTINAAGVIVDTNKAFEKVIGYTKEETVEMHFHKLFADQVQAEKIMKEAIEKGVVSQELTILTKDKREIPVLISVSARRDEEGNITYVGSFTDITERKRTEEKLRKHREHLEKLVEEHTTEIKTINEELQRDITERRRAEEELREREEKCRTMFEAVGDGIIVTDLTSTIVDANEAAARLAGLSSKEELIGRKAFEFVSPEDRELAMDATRKTLEEGRIQRKLEYKVLTADGRELHIDSSAGLMRDSSGNPLGIVNVVRDITERKRTEEELRESEERFRALFEDSPDLTLLVNRKGVIENVNEAVCRKTGLNKEEVVGKSFRNLPSLTKESAEEAIKNFKRRMAGEEALPYTVEFKTKGGEILHAEVNAELLKKEGEIVGEIVVARDITERKKAENRIKMEREVFRLIARAANRSRDVEDLCEQALKSIQNVVKYDMANILIYRESENALFSAAQVGYPEDVYERIIKRQDLKEGSGVAARAARERKSVYIDDMKTSKLVSYAHDLIMKYDISTLYAVPLFSWDKLQGVLEVLTVGDKKLSKEDREVLDTVSEELAGGITKAKIEETLLTVKEAFGWLHV